MADEQSTAPVDEVDTSVEQDTSTDEDTEDTDDPESDLKDDDTSFDDFEDEPEDTDQSDGFDEEADDSAKSEPKKPEEEPEEDDKDEATDDEPVEKPDQKEQARLAYEARQAEKAARAERERAKAESQAKYLDGAEDDKDLAVRQLQIDAYNNKVERNQSKIDSAIDMAMANIPLFTKGTETDLADMYEAVELWDKANIVRDKNGDPIEIKTDDDLVQFLQRKAARIEAHKAEGAQNRVKAKSNEKSRTLPRPGRVPKKAKADPLMEGFDDEADRY